MNAKLKAPRCTTCRRELTVIRGHNFSATIFLVLIFLGFFPGVIYYFLVKLQNHEICFHCTTEAAGIGSTRDKKWTFLIDLLISYYSQVHCYSSPKRVKSWYYEINKQWYFEVRYGNKPIELSKGKAAITVDGIGNLLATIDLVIEAANNGEFDTLLEARGFANKVM